ncbi:hypothetical protein [Geodermatophilus sp. SYSU D00815]
MTTNAAPAHREHRWAHLRAALHRPAVAYPAAAVVVVVVSVVTVLLRRRVPSPFNLSAYDGLLYVRQARSIAEGDWLGAFDDTTLAKAPGYPLFIAATVRLGIGLKDAEQLVALAAALLTAVCVLVVARRPWWALAAFVVLAFDPIFLSRGGADFLRDPLFASVTVLVVASLFLTGYLLAHRRSVLWPAVSALVAGLSLAAYLLTREEGVTVLPTAAAALLAAPVLRLLRRRRAGGLPSGRRLLRALARALPAALVLGLAAAGPVVLVTDRNERAYGVGVTTDWAQGSFLDAYAQWQRVDAGPVPDRVPISEAQREAVYEVSPAARLLAPSLEDPANGWRVFGCTTPPDCDYAGGWMPWALRTAPPTPGRSPRPRRPRRTSPGSPPRSRGPARAGGSAAARSCPRRSPRWAG